MGHIEDNVCNCLTEILHGRRLHEIMRLIIVHIKILLSQ
jgi:hypothetical protein